MSTKKDFLRAVILVEAAAKNAGASEAGAVAAAFVTFFEDQNPRFDVKRFTTACEDAIRKGCAARKGKAA